jgi:ATP-binding cassette subfamily C (CFTR/MRP) protein 1
MARLLKLVRWTLILHPCDIRTVGIDPKFSYYPQFPVPCKQQNSSLIAPTSIVGSKGIALSGGQKQRLALARPIYTKPSLLIVDDGFSGLDAETEERVFTRLFGRHGLLLQLRTTVIIVTHAVHRLPYANHIITLNARGRIAEQGTFPELCSSGGYVGSLATKHKFEDWALSDEEEIETPFTNPGADAREIDKIEAKEDKTTRSQGEFSTYKYYFESIGWMRGVLLVFMMFSSSVYLKITELLLIWWTGAVTARANVVNPFYLCIYCTLSCLAIQGFNGGVYYYFLSLVPASAEQLHFSLLRAVMAAPFYFFTKTVRTG